MKHSLLPLLLLSMCVMLPQLTETAKAQSNDLVLDYDATTLTEEQKAQDPVFLAYPKSMTEKIKQEVTFTCSQPVEGLGPFSVSATQQVIFSPGNLQYQASTKTWRFAEHQWNYIGDANKNISSSYSGWIDLFSWGTGDNPTKSSTNNSDYSTFTDWGVNPISTGGNAANLWRTLTKDEWVYLFHGRANAEKLFGLGTVNGVQGTIILPDGWSTPSGLTFIPSTDKGLAWLEINYYNSKGDNFSHNTYTSSQWEQMEANGAVFLPVSGNRYGTSVDDVGTNGYYWSSTPNGSSYAYFVLFRSNNLNPEFNNSRHFGLSVRLVSGL
ncbi:MAG: hypothetical protein K5660_00105 [Paludibacteraceae bacterium]|nr:hypothetical protein [Paludibacteraceae bacterium]